MGFSGSKEKPPAMDPEQVLPGMLFLLVLGGGVLAFLAIRKLSIPNVFGLARVPLGSAAGRGLGMLLTAMPIVGVFSVITFLLLKGEASLFTAGPFVQESGPARTIGFLAGFATYRF